MDYYIKLPREILRIVCEFVATTDLETFCSLFYLSKQWSELNHDLNLWISVGRANGIIVQAPTIDGIKERLQAVFFRNKTRNDILNHIATNKNPNLSIIMDIIRKYSSKSRYEYYNIINLCDVGILVECLDIFKLGLSTDSIQTINPSRLKLLCVTKSSIPLFDFLISHYPQPESDHVTYEVGSSSLEFAKHFITTRKPTKSALNSMLASAINKNNFPLVEYLIANGADIDFYVNDRQAIHHAAHNANRAIVKLLLNKGANVNSIDLVGWSPLLTVLHVLKWQRHNSNDNELVKLLLSYGADVNVTCFSGSCLHFCTRNPVVMKMILDKEPTIVNFADRSGNTALHEAMSMGGDLDCILMLLRHNADIYKVNSYGSTPLQLLASNQDWFEVVKYMIDANMDTSVWLPDVPGHSFLHFAARKGNKDAILKLLDGGYDINMNKTGLTPLEVALTCTSVFTIKFLLDLGANVNVQNPITKETPLHIVARAGWPIYVKLLLRYGADIRAKNIDENTPLDVAFGVETCYWLFKTEYPTYPKKKLEKLVQMFASFK